ncbi:hypothetical protein Nepgr_025392 [Nepenthes gracilis]|uniref:Uncharacterized protein n=1 Tax=Nepenthes gracilis TaxID=150966 RepID=A0AAD3Y104_NEPGR|nr:hypothetical protein Nepgr_025392 [Nepenthes gracilis]
MPRILMVSIFDRGYQGRNYQGCKGIHSGKFALLVELSETLRRGEVGVNLGHPQQAEEIRYSYRRIIAGVMNHLNFRVPQFVRIDLFQIFLTQALTSEYLWSPSLIGPTKGETLRVAREFIRGNLLFLWSLVITGVINHPNFRVPPFVRIDLSKSF